ncbi:hypothetical protein Tco_0803517 [Tanacetum coccineum]|uniref:CCHC-type domain-containing protein n=1 Tax=Tanacetum coccineum TaxID=301880 RepID=A0ABQ5A1T1_9ASTR
MSTEIGTLHGKPLVVNWRSIQNGPTPHPQITVIEGQGEAAVQVTRDKRDEEFTEIENNKELVDIQATNFLKVCALGNVGNTGNQGTQNYVQITDNVGKKVICYNCRGEGHMKASFAQELFMANLSSTSGTNDATTSQVNEREIDDNTILYHQYQLDNEVQDVPTEVSSAPPGEISMITILVKPDLDQTIIQCNKRNAELKEENVLLKSKLSQNVESINSLKNETKKVVSFLKRRTVRNGTLKK